MDARSDRGESWVVWIAAAVLIAGLAAAVPFVMAGRSQVQDAKSGVGTLGEAQDTSVKATLENAIRSAEYFYAENGTFVGFDAATAASFDPSVVYNTSPAAVAGQVSIRGVTATTVVLAERSESGAVLCIAATGEVVTRGRVDAAWAPACAGDW